MNPISNLYRLLPRDRQLMPWGPMHRRLRQQSSLTLFPIGGALDPTPMVIPPGYTLFMAHLAVLATPGIGQNVVNMGVDLVDENDEVLLDLFTDLVAGGANITKTIHERVNDLALPAGEVFMKATVSFNSAANVNTVILGWGGIVVPKGKSARFF